MRLARLTERTHHADAVDELDDGLLGAFLGPVVDQHAVAAVAVHHPAEQQRVPEDRQQQDQGEPPLDREQVDQGDQRDGEGADEVDAGVRDQIVQRLDVVAQVLLHLARDVFAEPAERDPAQLPGEPPAHRELEAAVDQVGAGQDDRLQHGPARQHQRGEQEQPPHPVGVDRVVQQFPARLDHQDERHHRRRRHQHRQQARDQQRHPDRGHDLLPRPRLGLLLRLRRFPRRAIPRPRRGKRRLLHRHRLSSPLVLPRNGARIACIVTQVTKVRLS